MLNLDSQPEFGVCISTSGDSRWKDDLLAASELCQAQLHDTKLKIVLISSSWPLEIWKASKAMLDSKMGLVRSRCLLSWLFFA